MLLRTVVLLLLCVSTGMCAALGHYQTQAEGEEAPAVDSAAVTDGVVAAASVDAAEEDVAPADTKVEDSPAAEEPAANSIVGDNLLAEILAGDDPAADKPEADVQAADKPEADVQAADKPEADVQAADKPEADVQAADKPEADVQAADKPEADVQAADKPEADVQAADKPEADVQAADKPEADVQAADNPEVDVQAADKPEADVPVTDGATAKEPETDSDGPAGDAPAMEALTGEAVTQEQPSSSEAEEQNDIRPVQTDQNLNEPSAHEEDNSWSLNSIRNSFQAAHGYFDSLMELAGGRNGVCQYRCRYGETPQPRPGYQLPEPNGCSSSLVGFQVNDALDLGIPAMTNCCNQLDVCYDTCGISKEDCDSKFRMCLRGICSDLKKSLGFVSKVQACESVADALHNTVGTLGCRPYMNSQRAACVCEGEERDEL